MNIDINILKQLRELTQAPLKDCKDVLIEAWGDLQKAQEILKKKWALKAAKKADRDTNEWIVKIIENNWKIIWLKLACETDFVAKNDLFVKLVEDVLDLLKSYWKDVLSLETIDSWYLNDTILPLIQDNIARIWENIRLLDVFISSKKWYIYAHPWNKVSSVVYYEGEDSNQDVAKEIALQITAMNPTYLSIESIPSEIKDSMKAECSKEMEWSNKPADIIEKIIEWKLMKSYNELVLLEQSYIRDDTKKIKNIIPSNMKIVDFKRFAI